jgi:hypothetical protein
MGAPSGPNQFWQLFMLAGPGGRWSLRTPPGIATNGALVLAGQDRQTLITGIRPSLDLGFSPVTATRDGGGTWSSLPPDPGFANVPDALAATAGGRLIALGLDQAVQVADSQQAAWTTLTTAKALAATAAGRRCALARLTAVAYTPAGSPLLAGICGRAGTAGVFARQDGSWQLVGPALPAALSGRPVQVIRLSQVGGRDGPGATWRRLPPLPPRAGRRPGPARPRHHRPARRGRQHADRLAADRAAGPLEPDPGHQGADPVRLLQRQLAPYRRGRAGSGGGRGLSCRTGGLSALAPGPTHIAVVGPSPTSVLSTQRVGSRSRRRTDFDPLDAL